MIVHQPVYILSAEKSELTTEENAQRTEQLRDGLKRSNVAFRSVSGKYKGKEEASVMIPQTENDLGFIERIAREFDQESYLFSDSNRYTTLHMMKGDTYHVSALGILKPTSKEYAEKQDGYTFDGENYYIID